MKNLFNNLKHFNLFYLLAILILLVGGNLLSQKKDKNMSDSNLKIAYFAGGCFWCMEQAFEAWDGVKEAESGYMGGHTENPTYKEVSSKKTGHAEIIRVIYDSSVIDYAKLLTVYWMNIDPTQENGQFCDKGSPYRTVIFYSEPEEKQLIDESIEKVKSKLLIKGNFVTEITPAKTFYSAEGYHQSYYKKNPLRYKYYKYSCGREQRLKKIWGSFYQNPKK